MPNYTWSCNNCKNSFEKPLTLKEYDEVRLKKANQLKVKCPDCKEYFPVVRTYDNGAPGISFGPGFFKDGYQSASKVRRDQD